MDALDASRASPQELHERFGLLAADAREYALYLVSPEGRLLCWNPGAERLFGYQSNEVVGQHFSRFFIPEDIRNGQPEHELRTALADGQSHSVRWQMREDGTKFWCKATTTALRDDMEQVGSFARVMHDLTENEKQQAQQKRADDLADANRSKEEFLALLAHELRNPCRRSSTPSASCGRCAPTTRSSSKPATSSTARWGRWRAWWTTCSISAASPRGNSG